MPENKMVCCLLICFLLASSLISAEEKTNISQMVFVKSGTYQMGDTFGDGTRDEIPVHEVCLDDFYIDKYEVTQKEYQKVMGNNPSIFKNCDSCPVENVTWSNAQEYCDKVGKRLPTEAEWEYAARSGGKKEKYAGTNDNLGEYAWYNANSENRTHPVGQKQPNGLGLYDMSGNVWEWCRDWYDNSYYTNSPKDNPQGPTSGQNKVLRGGSWYTNVNFTRSDYRYWFLPDFRYNYGGLRCVRTK